MEALSTAVADLLFHYAGRVSASTARRRKRLRLAVGRLHRCQVISSISPKLTTGSGLRWVGAVSGQYGGTKVDFPLSISDYPLSFFGELLRFEFDPD